MAQVLGCVKYVPVSYRSMVIPLYFFMLRNVTFKVIFGSSILAAIHACLNYRRQQVLLTVGEKQFTLPSLSEPPAFDGARKDSAEFNSP